MTAGKAVLYRVKMPIFQHFYLDSLLELDPKKQHVSKSDFYDFKGQ